MTISSGLRRLAEVVDELERADVEVRDASLDPSADETGAVVATVELAIPVESAATGTDSTVGGTLDDRDSIPDPDGPTGNGGRRDARGATVSDAGADGSDDATDETGVIACPEPGCDATFESEPGMKVHRTKVHLSNGQAADGDPPAYRDPERLAAVYESEDTFPAMRDALDADVSAQTVRRHMIRHGIHDPEAGVDSDVNANGTTGNGESGDAHNESADGSSDPDDDVGSDPDDDAGDEPQVLTDGAALVDLVPADMTLPDDLKLGDLRRCVEDADTLYDVQQRFELDRETARELLAAFDLLELVHGRVATRREREELKDEIDRRIRANLVDTPSP